MNRRAAPSPAARARARGRIARYTAVAAALVLVFLAAVYVAARAYLPELVASTESLEARLTELAQHPVRIGAADVGWDGFYPRIRALDLTVHGEAGEPAVRVAELRARIAPLPLLWGQVELRRLVLVRPGFTLERRADGRIGIAGLAPRAQGGAGAAAGWLLRQPHVVIRDGELHWRDAKAPGDALSFAGVDIDLRNAGARHRLALQADFPDALCRACSFSADLDGLPVDGAWDGEIALRAQALDLGRLPLAARELLPLGLQGRIDARLRGDWHDGRVRSVRGEIAAEGLRVAIDPQAPFAARHLDTEVSWRAGEAGWQLELADLTVGLTDTPWHTGRLRIEHGEAQSRVEVDHVELDDLTRLLAAHRARHPWLERLVALGPSGALHHVEAEITGPLAAPRGYALRARLDNFGTAAHERRPSVRGVSGRLSLDADGGALDLDATDFSLHLPAVFRAPLAAARARGALRWRRAETAWHVTGGDLEVQAEDDAGTGSLALELPQDSARSPLLDLRVDFRDGNGAHAKRYYPVHALPPRVLAWMESAFVAGRITAGHLIYDGPIRAFPFEQGEGRFELRAEVRDGVYRYLPGWAPLTEVEAAVAIDGADALITGHGRIGALRAHDIRVAVARRGDDPGRTVRVRGVVEGPIAETLHVLRAAEPVSAPAWRAPLERIAQASGSGRLDLEVQVPLRNARPRSFLAAYRFENAVLELERGMRLEEAAGTVRLSEAGFQEGRLDARLYGGRVAASAARSNGELRVQARGTALLSELLRERPALARRVDGSIDWSLSWRERARGPELRFESDLSRVRTRLPPPLDHPAGGLAGKLTVTTASSRADALTLALDGGPAMSGTLLLRRGPDGWRLHKGRLDLGRPAGQLRAGEGLVLGLDIDALDLDGWLPLLAGNRRSGSAGSLLGINAHVKRLILLGRDWGQLFLHLVHHGGEWRAVLDGDAVAGEATLAPGDGDRASRVKLDLAYLRLAPRVHEAGPGGTGPDPRRLPAIDLEAGSFEYKQRRYGELVLRAAPYAHGWRIERLSLSRPDTALSMSGTWRRDGAQDASSFSLQLESEDMGAALDAWGARGQMAQGKVKLQANLSWPGTPTDPTLSGLDGRLQVSAEDGRFLRFDPGAARLFGLLDLRAIGRYLTLDFSPAFGKGLVFDAIHGAIAIARGNATTDAFILSGPSLNLHAAGRIGLASEDYDLVLDVSPRVSDTLTLTSWGLFGPQAAAAILALQRLFRRQIEEGTRISYVIKGPWEDPEVTRLPKPGPADRNLPDPTP